MADAVVREEGRHDQLVRGCGLDLNQDLLAVRRTDPSPEPLYCMRRRELARYHDLAASTKVRGAGIGFAGVGIKIALLVCAEVLTETRRRGHHVASAWRLASRQKAPWRWVPPPGLVADHGTAVRLILDHALSPLVDHSFIEASLRRNFQPLFEPTLGDILRERYPYGVVFVLNSRVLQTYDSSEYVIAPIVIRLGRKRRPAGAGYLVRDSAPLPEDLRGVAISTFGKVIKRGWDWLGLTPGAPEHVGGLIVVPALAECLALNKIDFIRAGARGATYLAYRKAIQEAVSQQLAEWGDASESTERARRHGARPVERDLELVLRTSRTISRSSRAWSSSAPADSVGSRSPAPALRAMRPLALASPRRSPLSHARRGSLPRRAMRRRLRNRSLRRRPHRPQLRWVTSQAACDTGARRATD